MKIMVVDDDPDIVYTVKVILQKEGYEVMGAVGGEECLEKLKHIKPDLVLLDIMMPLVDGWDVLKKMRNDENLKNIPVAMLTVKSISLKTVKARDIRGLIDYVVKPFTKEKLTEAQLIDKWAKFFWIDKPFTREGLISRIKTIFECIR